MLKNENTKLRGVVTQQNTIIRKLKAQRQELLTFYKKHKKYELREAQIENQKSLLDKVEKKYEIEASRTAEMLALTEEVEYEQSAASPDFGGRSNLDIDALGHTSFLKQTKGSEMLKNNAFFKD